MTKVFAVPVLINLVVTALKMRSHPHYGSYHKIIVAFSGGKDSLACVLDLLDQGVRKSRIELWHHDVDGREGSKLMDWAITRDYCRKVAESLDLPLYFSWLEGGFEREMLRDETAKSRTLWEQPGGTIGSSGGKGKPGTRRKFPQVSGDLSVRWCSAYLKIDVMSAAIAGQKRFDGKAILIVTGERAEESAGRAKYKTFELHRTNGKKRTAHQWRPVHKWDEAKVWGIIERYNISPHPAYYLGWGRLSCMTCIFGSKDQWASVKVVDADKFDRIAEYEEEFGLTIQRKESIRELAAKGEAYSVEEGTEYAGMYLVQLITAQSETYNLQIHPEKWTLPKGAFGESCGPT